LKKDERFEIVSCNSSNQKFSTPLEPYWPNFCIQPLQSTLNQIEVEFKRHKFMLIGESAFLIKLKI